MCLTPYPTSSSKQPVKRRSNANKLKPFTFHIINFTEATSGPESPSSSPSHSPSPSNNSTDSIETSVPQLNNGLNVSVNQQQPQSTSSSLNHTSSDNSQSFTAATTINQSVTHNTTSHINNNNNNNSNTTSSSRKTYVACTLATAAPQNALIKAQIDRYIHLPQPEAAKRLGISLSTLKRRFYETYPGQRWPHTIASASNHNVTTANNNSFQYTVNRANHSPRTELHTNPIQAPNVVSMGTPVTSTVIMSSSPSTRSTSRATSEPTIATMPPVHYTTQSNNKINHYDYQSSPPLQQLPPLQHSTYSRASIVPPSARIEKPRKMARELLVNSINRDEKFIDAMTMQALQNAFSSNPIR